MKNPPNGDNRRSFLQKSALAASGAIWSVSPTAKAEAPREQTAAANRRLPREVWIATISQNGLRAKTHSQMSRLMLERMKEVVACRPDIICLPEVFPFSELTAGRPPLKEVAEVPIGEVARPFAEFARNHRCYVICPIYTREKGQVYNAAVLIDRRGALVGEYRKMHPTIGEIEKGITPGPLDPPVFKTDFGLVGAQICFDIEWVDGWRKLRQAGAEIVFWPSAFAGGSMVNGKAWRNQYCVVSSTRKDTSKICDITGEEAGRTSRWNHWVCASINLEKAFLHTWPYVRRFPEIQAKYGRKIRIRNRGEEEWSILESRSPDVRIAEVLKEFDLKTYHDHIQTAEVHQRASRA